MYLTVVVGMVITIYVLPYYGDRMWRGGKTRDAICGAATCHYSRICWPLVVSSDDRVPNGTPITQATIDLVGTDLVTAVAGRVSLDDLVTMMVLRRIDVWKGWREIYDGPVPQVGYAPGEARPRCLCFAAPAPEGDNGWIKLTFQVQHNASWSTACSPWTAIWEVEA